MDFNKLKSYPGDGDGGAEKLGIYEIEMKWLIYDPFEEFS